MKLTPLLTELFVCFSKLLLLKLALTEQSSEEANTDKKIGFIKGLRETISFRPYLMLLLVELFTWLSVQVS